MSVVKIRASAHSDAIRLYDIDADGIAIGASLEEYQGILTGQPVLR